MPTITIPYKPRNWAKALHDATTRWIVLVLHRRAGKTTAILNHLQRDALRVPESLYVFIAITRVQAKRIAWDIAKRISRDIPGVQFNESELTVIYPNGSKLMLLGSENVDSLRGMAIWGGGQDESAQQPSNLFSEVISKCLADHLGYWIWSGTPKGRGAFFRTYDTGKAHPDQYTVIFRTIDDSLKDETGETIENLRQALDDDKRLVAIGEMTREEYLQEWYCSFEAAIKGAYFASEIAIARKENRIATVPYDPSLKVHTVWDLGMDDATAIGFYQYAVGQLRKIDYYENTGQGLAHYIKVLQQKPYIYGKHFAPHDIQVRELGTGVSRLETAKKLGLEFKVVPNVSIADGINAARLAWHKLWVDETRCQTWLDYIAQYRKDWDDRRGVFRDNPYHDYTSHAADEFRYAALVLKQMTNDEVPRGPWYDRSTDLWRSA